MQTIPVNGDNVTIRELCGRMKEAGGYFASGHYGDHIGYTIVIP